VLVYLALFFFWKRFQNAKGDPKFSWKGVVLAIPMPGKNVLECHSDLHLSEKELPEQRSITIIPLGLPIPLFFLLQASLIFLVN
jgi:hypothetical protein